jgi:hypothetical protein
VRDIFLPPVETKFESLPNFLAFIVALSNASNPAPLHNDASRQYHFEIALPTVIGFRSMPLSSIAIGGGCLSVGDTTGPTPH